MSLFGHSFILHDTIHIDSAIFSLAKYWSLTLGFESSSTPVVKAALMIIIGCRIEALHWCRMSPNTSSEKPSTLLSGVKQFHPAVGFVRAGGFRPCSANKNCCAAAIFGMLKFTNLLYRQNAMALWLFVSAYEHSHSTSICLELE